MNKLIFSEGGQPVYLDDLKMLQENMTEMILALFPLTMGGDQFDDAGIKDVTGKAMYATPRHTNGSADANCETMQAHKLVCKDGTVYDVGFTSFGEEEGNPLDGYYALHESTEESRTFEDGTEHAVVKRYWAEIVAEEPTAGTYVKVSDVPSLDQLQALLPASEKAKAWLKPVGHEVTIE